MLLSSRSTSVSISSHSRSTEWTYARHGTIIIPISKEEADEDKPGWIVDGQQRSAAIRDARVDSFPICITAFIAESDQDQRSQFILVNSAKPLPKGLIYELLPGTVGTLPPQFQIREFPSRLLYRLNFTVDSPLYRHIQTPTKPEGTIKDNSILKMLESSLSDGALYAFRDPNTGEGDEEADDVDPDQTSGAPSVTLSTTPGICLRASPVLCMAWASRASAS